MGRSHQAGRTRRRVGNASRFEGDAVNAAERYEKIVTAKRNAAAGIDDRREARLNKAARAVGDDDRKRRKNAALDFVGKRAAAFEDRDSLIAKALRKLARKRSKQLRRDTR